MLLLSIAAIFWIGAILLFWMGSRRFLRTGAAISLCATALSIYSLSAPVSADLNESDRMGNEAARLIIAVLAASNVAAFCAGYIFSVWRRRKSQTGAQVGSK